MYLSTSSCLASITTVSTLKLFLTDTLSEIVQISPLGFMAPRCLTKWYYQVPMSTRDISKTSVIMPFGLFKWLRMLFGLRKSGSTSKCMMNQIYQGPSYCLVFVDLASLYPALTLVLMIQYVEGSLISASVVSASTLKKCMFSDSLHVFSVWESLDQVVFH